jgi:Family of unknown function (DUF6186)
VTRALTLVGYVVVAIAAAGLELAARRWRRGARLGDVLGVALRRGPVRLVVLAGWLWIGWHLFVRVHWR